MLNEFVNKPSHIFKNTTDEAKARRQVIAEYCKNLMRLLSPLSLKAQVCCAAIDKLLLFTTCSFLSTMITCNNCCTNSQLPSKTKLTTVPCPLLMQLLDGYARHVLTE